MKRIVRRLALVLIVIVAVVAIAAGAMIGLTIFAFSISPLTPPPAITQIFIFTFHPERKMPLAMVPRRRFLYNQTILARIRMTQACIVGMPGGLDWNAAELRTNLAWFY